MKRLLFVVLAVLGLAVPATAGPVKAVARGAGKVAVQAGECATGTVKLAVKGATAAGKTAVRVVKLIY